MEVIASPKEAEMANTTLGSSLSRLQRNIVEREEALLELAEDGVGD
jgi:hypothetical protein